MRTRRAVRAETRAKEGHVLDVALTLLAAEGRQAIRPARLSRAAGVTRSWVAQYLGDAVGIQRRLAEVSVGEATSRLLQKPANLIDLAQLLSGPLAPGLSLGLRFGFETELEATVLPYLQDHLTLMLQERRVQALSRRIWAAWSGVLLMCMSQGPVEGDLRQDLLEIALALAAAHKARSPKNK